MAQGSAEAQLRSCLCTQEELTSPPFQTWAERLGEPQRMLRKIWEWCYISAALEANGMLVPGKRGLGFAVGQEPLPSLFASRGCRILATDLPRGRAAAKVWIATDQHAAGLEQLNQRRLCSAEEFRERVSFLPCDMNRIPKDFRGFDFVWSACSLEHLGSIGLGERFINNSLECLQPGGVAVHTTEYNVSSNTDTVDYRTTVIFRRRDVERIVEKLEANGHSVAPLDLSEGTLPHDLKIDVPPYSRDIHLKLRLGKYVCTSIGMIITKRSDRIPHASANVTPRGLRDIVRPLGRRLRHRLKSRRGH